MPVAISACASASLIKIFSCAASTNHRSGPYSTSMIIVSPLQLIGLRQYSQMMAQHTAAPTTMFIGTPIFTKSMNR